MDVLVWSVMIPEVSGFTSSVVSSISLSSQLVYLDKEYLNDINKKEEVWTRSNNQQQQRDTHTFQGWKDCNNTNYSVPNRTPGMWALLADNLEYGTHNVSWLWQYHNPTTPFDTFQRRRILSPRYVPCRHCGNNIVFEDRERSPRGKLIPLNEWDHWPHNCQFSSYNKVTGTSVEKRKIRKIEESQIIDDLRNKVATVNNRLEHCEAKLIVEHKE